jgi:hypothetical protein
MREGKKDLVPPYSMFIISCGGIILHKDRVLLVQEKAVCIAVVRDSSRGITVYPVEGPTSDRE